MRPMSCCADKACIGASEAPRPPQQSLSFKRLNRSNDLFPSVGDLIMYLFVQTSADRYGKLLYIRAIRAYNINGYPATFIFKRTRYI